jgi:hypothetical protein
MRDGVDGKMARYARDEREGGLTGHKAGYSRAYDSVSAQDHLENRRDAAAPAWTISTTNPRDRVEVIE